MGQLPREIRIATASHRYNFDRFQEHIGMYDFDDGQSNKFKTIVAFDCRGLEPVDFSPRNGWNVKGYRVSETNGFAAFPLKLPALKMPTGFKDSTFVLMEWNSRDKTSMGRSIEL